MRITIRGFFISFLIASILPARLPAQQKAFWEISYKTPAAIFGDTATAAKRIRFSISSHADVVDGAGGTHYALWGGIRQEGTEFHVLWVSSDRGLTWKEARRSPIQEPSGAVPNPAWTFTDLSYPEPDNIVALALNNPPAQHTQIMRSTDGGITWQDTPLPRTNSSTEQGQIAMADGLHGAVMLQSSDGFFRTSDGWKTWERVSIPAAYFNDLFCPEPNVFILTGGYTSRSTDGGQTWTAPTAGPFGPMRPHMHSFVDRDYGWAIATESTGVGDRVRDRIARTTDGGQTWTEQFNGEELTDGAGLSAIDFADRMNGLVGGWRGILRTTDGGETWTPEDFPEENPIIRHITSPTPTSAVALSVNVFTYANKHTLAAPTIIQPGPLLLDSKDTVTIGWTPVQTATRYQIQMGRYNVHASPIDFDDILILDEANLTTTSRFFQLDYGDWVYSFRVRAMNAQDTSQWSTRSSVLTVNNPGSLVTPTIIFPSLDAKDVPTDVRIVWLSIPGATRYHLQVSTTPLFATGQPLLVDNPAVTDTTYLLTDLSPYTRYFCGVKAVSDAGESNWSWQMIPHLFETGATSGIDDDGTIHSPITILPNPAHESARISVAERPESVGLFDINGRLLYTPLMAPAPGPNGGWSVELDLRGLSAGTYMVRVRSEQGITTRSLLVHP